MPKLFRPCIVPAVALVAASPAAGDVRVVTSSEFADGAAAVRLNDAGQVGFLGYGAAGAEYVVDTGGNQTAVIREDDGVPGLPGPVEFSDPLSLRFNLQNDGTVGLNARFGDSSPRQSAAILADAGGVQLVAREGTAPPAGMGMITNVGYPLRDAGGAAYVSVGLEGGSFAAPFSASYRVSGDEARTIFRTGQMIDGQGYSADHLVFSVFGRDGYAIHQIQPSVDDLSQRVILQSFNGGPHERVVGSGDLAPGGGRFSLLLLGAGEPDVTAEQARTFSFGATLADAPNGRTGDVGLFHFDGQEVVQIAREQTDFSADAPYLTLPRGATEAWQDDIAFSPGGKAAFVGLYREPGSSSVLGVLRADRGEITPVVEERQSNPDSPYEKFQVLGANDRGNVLFLAGESGFSATPDNADLLVFDDRLGLVRVAGPGDDVAGFVVDSIDPRNTALNAAGQVAYRAEAEFGAGSAIGLWDLPNPLDGDANLDGAVTIADFAVLRANFGSDAAYFTTGDFDGDSAVTIADFALLRANFGGSAAQAAELDAWAAAVPEPAGVAVVAAAGLALVRRR